MISTEAASGRNDRDEVNVVAMVQVAWRYRYFIAAVAVVVVIAAVIVALTTTPVFRAQAVVTEARDEAMGAGSSLASQLGGLASIARRHGSLALVTEASTSAPPAVRDPRPRQCCARAA